MRLIVRPMETKPAIPFLLRLYRISLTLPFPPRWAMRRGFNLRYLGPLKSFEGMGKDGDGNARLPAIRLDPHYASLEADAEGIAQVRVVDFEDKLSGFPGGKGLLRFEEYSHGTEVAGYAHPPFQHYGQFAHVPRHSPPFPGIQHVLPASNSPANLKNRLSFSSNGMKD